MEKLTSYLRGVRPRIAAVGDCRWGVCVDSEFRFEAQMDCILSRVVWHNDVTKQTAGTYRPKPVPKRQCFPRDITVLGHVTS
jgi:hypothetical protein